MRILLVTNYFEPDSGAAAVRLTRLAKILQQRGHQITVLTSMPHYPQGKIHPNYRNRFIVTENRNGLRIIQTWLFPTPSPKISRRLVSQCSFMLTASFRGLGIRNVDVILIEAQPIFTAFAGVFLATFKRSPYILNISDLWPDHLLSVGVLSETSRIYRIARKLVNTTYRHANAIITLSPVWSEKIKTHVETPEKIHTIYNGVALDKFFPNQDITAFRQKYDIGASKIISFIGTFATQYNFEMMIDVARKFDNQSDTQVVFIGQGSQSEMIKSHIQDSNIRWIPWIKHYEMPLAWNLSTVTYWAMRDHDLYTGVIPAKLYEAMASGTPVVALQCGIAADVIRESGIGLVANDKNELYEDIQKMLTDTEFHQQCQQSARRYAEENYNPQHVASRYEAVLEAAKRENQ